MINSHPESHLTGYIKYCKTMCSILVLLMLLTCCGNDKGRPFSNYVVLVSLDAFRWDYPQIYKTPNLDKMALSGTKADRMISSFPSKTFPNHYAMATGLYPDHNGIVENTFFAPDLNKMYSIGNRASVEDPAFYFGEPIWVTAMKNGMKTASFYWVGSEAPVMGMHPDYWKKFDDSVPYGARIDTVIKWLEYPANKRPQFITLYFEEPDAVSHDFGPVSEETGMLVERMDSLLGVLQSKLSKLTIAGKINLIVVSDHGMGEITSDKYINIKEVIPERMVRSMTGGNPVYMIEPNGNFRDSILYRLNQIDGITAWAKSDIPAYLHYGASERIMDIVVAADSSWSIATFPDTIVFRGGAHGYDISDSDMDAIFYATGPAIKKNYSFKELNNVDVYNLICRILKINPAENDGNPAYIKGILR
jgi:predicted AlkP superfamily pyrophosphatase or phosphodiesterase